MLTVFEKISNVTGGVDVVGGRGGGASAGPDKPLRAPTEREGGAAGGERGGGGGGGGAGGGGAEGEGMGKSGLGR